MAGRIDGATAIAGADWVIDEIPIPASVGDDSWSDFVGMNDVRNLVEADVTGTRDLWRPAAELLPVWQNRYEPKRLFVARAGGRIVGRGIYETRIDESSTTCWLEAQELPEYAGAGICEGLHAALIELAGQDGRLSANYYVLHRETGSADRIVPPTGFGSVPADEDYAVFLTAHGYRLGQVERMSRLALPADPGALARLSSAASAAAGPDYRVVHWLGRTPEEWVAGIAELNTRMSTDAPIGSMAEDDDPWDDARVRTDDDLADAGPRVQLVAGVVHEPSGELVGFNELSIPPEPDRPVDQEDTLVLAGHRGHRLGMLLKVANLQRLAEVAPGHPSVLTFNAEENRHMLSVNEAVGFVPVGYEGGWTRTL